MAATSQKRTKASATPPEERVWTPWITHAALILTLALMIARAMMMETIREGTDVIPGLTAAPRGVGAAGSLLLDALCILPALLVLIRRSVDRHYIVRWSWSHVFLAAAALWAAISFKWSSDRFTTLVQASNFIAAAALVWATAQLVRSWARLRLVAGVAVGLLLIYAAQGLIYRLVDVPDNVRYWNENKQRILQERGWEADSFSALQFEKKLIGGEMVGFNQSPNSFAAVIVLLVVITSGAAIQRIRNGDGIGWVIATALPIAPALIVLYFTNSRTAAGTLFIAACAFAVLSKTSVRAWLATHSRLAYFSVVALALLSTAALVGHGAYHGSLPQDSLNFRWRYWVAGWRLFTQHALAGVGWGNFGPHYLFVRLPPAAEEVRDPHNFIVRALVELGLIGGALVLAWLARATWELTRPVAPSTAVTPSAPRSSSPLFLNIVSIAAGGVLLNALIAIDFSQQRAFITLELFRRFLALGLLCIGMLVVAVRGTKQQELDDRPAPWLLYGLLIGLGVFFVHNLMDFAISEPGPLTIFAVLLGAALGLRTRSAAGLRQRQNAARAWLAVGAIAWILAVLLVVIPVSDAEQRAQQADAAIIARRPDIAAGLFNTAFLSVPFNADYAYRSARALIMASAEPEKVKALLDLAINTEPTNGLYRLTRARYAMGLPAPDAAAVRADFEAALKLDPRGMQTRLDYADVLQKLGDRAEAARQYRLALQQNSLYDPTEPKRLSPEKVREIEQLIGKLAA
jgi:O-antigen ligase